MNRKMVFFVKSVAILITALFFVLYSTRTLSLVPALIFWAIATLLLLGIVILHASRQASGRKTRR